jgi:hypothetical protein
MLHTAPALDDLLDLVEDKERWIERWQIMEAEGVPENVRIEVIRKQMRGER